ncbi:MULTISPECIES: LacI family DNA-binding transcriptional regulator [Thioclava]|uniref:LacI family DNA-binding transcriptional regulator n=1 Tax=Thioclava TaxID=285107 RepID=UPI000B539281|nr:MULTISPECIES: LacI family DNA-binding transcriptional regulator [Thioclava]OWY01892.1 LacI family transcriptional regulator [Thioclava sp. F1Mire-8]OWY10194.1 LacI family transcriptional regulator [Thioclava sp. F42-5]OWY17485.1 LacI family transcriptional regulator [Thioclava sp. JM3]PWE49131.1 LacI family transcriptional regulator [Thioclava sp. NG1]WGT49635.1 LacI family DNA-binding transcriptional regulator [Thioclava nitratireducens]
MTEVRRPNFENNITADDVAEAAGVSRWTVNRAFKKDASISPKTRTKVMEAANKLGYVPDLRAAALASDRSNLVALLVDDFANPHKLVMMERLTRILRKHGWDTLLVNTLDRDDAGHAILNASQRRVDAAILIGIQFDDDVLETALHARRFHKLIIFARTSRHPDTISIAVDDALAMQEITAYVAERGYRRPLFLAGPRTYSAHLLRKETFLGCWERRFGTIPEFAEVPAYDPILAEQVVTRMLTDRPRDEMPDILVCENDALAIGAIDVIRHKLGLRIPEDIAVTGFDDVPQCQSPNYALTTYRQPLTEMAEYLVEVLESSEDRDFDRAFKGTLVPRASA